MESTSNLKVTLTRNMIIGVFGILIGIGTASWCLGMAGALAMMMFLLKE